MTIQTAQQLQRRIEQSTLATVLKLHEAPGLPGAWVLDICWQDTEEVETIDALGEWDDLLWRRYPREEYVVILMQGGHTKVCKHRDGFVFIPALNWAELEQHAHAVIQTTSYAPRTEQGATFWLCPRALAARAVFPDL